MTTLSPQPYKGTRDWYPEDKAVQNYIFSIWREVVESFGYREYGAPLLEPLAVYAAKSGDELAGEQTYAFSDRGGREVAIRPEMTPSISRMVAARRQELAYPARLYSIANFMRYERPQRGREREFWQLNVDMFGSDSASSELEMLQLASALLQRFGARPDMYEIRVNNRLFINDLMTNLLGLDDVQARQTVRLIDRKAKLAPEAFASALRDVVVSDKFTTLMQVLEATSLEAMPEVVRTTPAAMVLRQLLEQAAAVGIGSVRFDVSLMRGLDYYTGTVFEVYDTDPENNRSLFGGGRYDGLVGLFGAESLSAVGFAPGLTTTELFLRSHQLLPDLTPKLDLYIAAIGATELACLQLAARARATGLQVEVDTSGRKLDKLMKTAEKKGASEIVFVGQDELETGRYSAKNLATGTTRDLPL